MLSLAGVVALALGVAGCAPARPETAQADPTPAAPLGGGRIVSVRPLTVAASSAILVALNEGGIARGSRPPAAVEFIIREDDGRTVSVVQSDAAGFRPGDRVFLTGAPRTRIARPAT